MTIPFISKVVTLRIIFIKQDRLDGNSLVIIKDATAQVVGSCRWHIIVQLEKTNQSSNTRQNEVVVTTNLDNNDNNDTHQATKRRPSLMYCTAQRFGTLTTSIAKCRDYVSLSFVSYRLLLMSICLSFVAYEYVLRCHIFRTIYPIEISSCIDIKFRLQLYGPVYGYVWLHYTH